jgi:hypothetical protein
MSSPELANKKAENAYVVSSVLKCGVTIRQEGATLEQAQSGALRQAIDLVEAAENRCGRLIGDIAQLMEKLAEVRLANDQLTTDLELTRRRLNYLEILAQTLADKNEMLRKLNESFVVAAAPSRLSMDRLEVYEITFHPSILIFGPDSQFKSELAAHFIRTIADGRTTLAVHLLGKTTEQLKTAVSSHDKIKVKEVTPYMSLQFQLLPLTYTYDRGANAVLFCDEEVFDDFSDWAPFHAHAVSERMRIVRSICGGTGNLIHQERGSCKAMIVLTHGASEILKLALYSEYFYVAFDSFTKFSEAYAANVTDERSCLALVDIFDRRKVKYFQLPLPANQAASSSAPTTVTVAAVTTNV